MVTGVSKAPISSPVGFNPFSMAVGDFNGDGIPDIAAITGGFAINDGFVLSILLGRANGAFSAGVSYPTGMDNAVYLAIGDFNGDGGPTSQLAATFMVRVAPACCLAMAMAHCKHQQRMPRRRFCGCSRASTRMERLTWHLVAKSCYWER